MHLKILSVQFDSVWQARQANLLQLEKMIEQASSELVGCDVLLLPELFHCGFSMAIEVIAELKQGQVYQALSDLASSHGIYVIAGVALQGTGDKALNSALVFDRQGMEIACYLKNHTFNYAQEGDYFQAGNQTVIFEIDGVPCSVFICYDLRFPELFRAVAQEVEVMFVIANWPATRQMHWSTLLSARAIENQCFVVGVNRIGIDGHGLHYLGGSMVVDPTGERLSYGTAEESLILTIIDTAKVQAVRRQFPFLTDMKTSG